MLTLQTVCPYGLNDRLNDAYMAEKEIRVLYNFKVYKRPDYSNSKIKLDNSFLKKFFVKTVTTYLDYNLKDAGYFICVSINSFLKHVCNDVSDLLRRKPDSFPNQHWNEMTLVLIESRIYNPPASRTSKTKPKNIIRLHFVNKDMDTINISKDLHKR